jgi:hypothetical protein
MKANQQFSFAVRLSSAQYRHFLTYAILSYIQFQAYIIFEKEKVKITNIF